MIRCFLTLFFIFSACNVAVAQTEQEYLGLLKINDSSFISYRINFKVLKDNSLVGYSVTDMGGAHETKSYVEGSYDPKEKTVFFKEYGIEYTKSDITSYDFCYVHFTGKLKDADGQQVLEGPFLGKYNDGVACINGDVMLKNMSKIEKIVKKVDRKIQRSKKLTDSIKESVSLSNLVDLQGLNVLKANEKTTVFAKESKVKVSLWDAGKLDGDKISVFFNGKNIINNYQIEKKLKTISLQLKKGENILKFRADNLGEIAPNTAKIELAIGSKVIDLLSNLKKGEFTTVVIIN